MRTPEMREEIETADLNVVILPDEETRQALISLSQELSKKVDSHFILNEAEFRPHLSLFPNQFPTRNRQGIENALKALGESSESLNIQLTGYSQISGYIFIDAVKTADLINLHSDAVSVLNPLREGHMPALVSHLKGLNDSQRDNVETYGNPIVLSTWEPHVTLTHIDDLERAKQILAELPPINLKFNAAAMHLSRFARWGTCPEILESFPLRS